MKGKNVLVTGGLGFIGSNLAIKLVELGANVTIIDSLTDFCGGNRFNIHTVKDKIRLELIDIKDEGVKELVKDQDLIFNLAGHTGHAQSVKNPLKDYEINSYAQVKFLETCRKHSNAKIIYAGTRAQYGRILYVPVDEKHPLNPVDVNGINKTTAEKYHLLYSKYYGIKSVSLRLTNVYGPRHYMKDNRFGFLNWFIRLAMDDKLITVYDGKQLRDFNYVADVVSAFLKAADLKEGVFNIGSGNPISVLDLAKLTVEAAKKGKIEIKGFTEERKQLEIGDYYTDFSRFKEETGWTPKVGLKEGLQKTVDFYAQNKALYW